MDPLQQPPSEPLLSAPSTPPMLQAPDVNSFLTTILNPSLPALVTTVLLIFTIPIFLHFIIFRSRAAKSLPTFLLLGPSNAGKTAILTSFADERLSSRPAETHASQTPLSLETDIPASYTLSSQYRSTSDPSLTSVTRFLLLDTPGHGKLRSHHALPHIANACGIIFVVDSSAPLNDAAEYLHDVLVAAQKVVAGRSKGGRMGKEMRVLVAANKSDLFTSLPKERVGEILEEEIGRVREARRRGIVKVGGEEGEEEEEWLGEGRGRFGFKEMEEWGVVVEVEGGSVVEEGGWREKLGRWVGGSL